MSTEVLLAPFACQLGQLVLLAVLGNYDLAFVDDYPPELGVGEVEIVLFLSSGLACHDEFWSLGLEALKLTSLQY